MPCLLIFFGSSPAAARVGGELSGFEPTGDYVLSIDGEEALLSEVFHSEAEVCLVVVAPEVPGPVLVDLKSSRAEVVPPASLERGAMGDLRLLAADSGTAAWHQAVRSWPPGEVSRRRGVIRLELGEHELILEPKPHQVGPQEREALRRRHPEMVSMERRARLDKSAGADVAALKAVREPVRVRVYYGSWCRSCDRLLGNVLALEEQLAESSVTFEYYGLPKPFDDDPTARSEGVQGVPVADVFVGDDRVGRLESLELRDPASSLSGLLAAGF